jgi:hypothetical protein
VSAVDAIAFLTEARPIRCFRTAFVNRISTDLLCQTELYCVKQNWTVSRRHPVYPGPVRTRSAAPADAAHLAKAGGMPRLMPELLSGVKVGGDGLGEARRDLLTWVSRHSNFSRPSTISSTERSRTDQHGTTPTNMKVGPLQLHSRTDQHEEARGDTGQHGIHVSFNPAGRVRDPGGPQQSPGQKPYWPRPGR